MAATTSLLADKLKALDLAAPLPKYPNCHPEVNPVDIYRAHLTSLLTEVTGVDAAVIYPALQWTQTLEKGDLVLPIPALRVKGKKPDQLATEWIEKVSHYLSGTRVQSVANLLAVPRVPLGPQALIGRHISPILLQSG